MVAVHQPNYAPWLGYFHKIAHADVFVFLDDVQFSKGSYTNRVRIGRDDGAVWLTQPVRHALGQAINEVGFAQNDWPARHLDALRGAYRRAACFDEIWSDLITMYERIPTDSLAAANRHLIEAIVAHLAIDCRFAASSDLHVNELKGDDRLVAIVGALAPGGTYLSGGGGDKYQDPAKFADAGIDLVYANFAHPDYPQGAARFQPGLSVLDAASHLGWAGTRALLDKD